MCASADFCRIGQDGHLTALCARLVLDAPQCDCRGERAGVNEPSHLPGPLTVRSPVALCSHLARFVHMRWTGSWRPAAAPATRLPDRSVLYGVRYVSDGGPHAQDAIWHHQREPGRSTRGHICNRSRLLSTTCRVRERLFSSARCPQVSSSSQRPLARLSASSCRLSMCVAAQPTLLRSFSHFHSACV